MKKVPLEIAIMFEVLLIALWVSGRLKDEVWIIILINAALIVVPIIIRSNRQKAEESTVFEPIDSNTNLFFQIITEQKIQINEYVYPQSIIYKQCLQILSTCIYFTATRYIDFLHSKEMSILCHSMDKVANGLAQNNTDIVNTGINDLIPICDSGFVPAQYALAKVGELLEIITSYAANESVKN